MNDRQYSYAARLASWGVTALIWAMPCFPALLFADPRAAPVQSGTSGLHEITSFDVYVDGRTIHLLVSPAGSKALHS
jgi:hypothetical protein